jgi:hypothetical protein
MLENETVTLRADDVEAILTACGCFAPDGGTGDLGDRMQRVHLALHGDRVPAGDSAPTLPEGGRWLELELLGHRQRTGYVTEVTVAGAAMLHIDLPAKLFGGEPDAWEEYAPSALYGLNPVREESVRRAWESQRRAAEERARREAEWQRMQDQRALTAGDDGDEVPDECACEVGYTCDYCRSEGLA